MHHAVISSITTRRTRTTHASLYNLTSPLFIWNLCVTATMFLNNNCVSLKAGSSSQHLNNNCSSVRRAVNWKRRIENPLHMNQLFIITCCKINQSMNIAYVKYPLATITIFALKHYFLSQSKRGDMIMPIAYTGQPHEWTSNSFSVCLQRRFWCQTSGLSNS